MTQRIYRGDGEEETASSLFGEIQSAKDYREVTEGFDFAGAASAVPQTGGVATPVPKRVTSAPSGNELKEAGIRRAVEHRQHEFNLLLGFAEGYARNVGPVTAEDVRQWALDNGIMDNKTFAFLIGAVFADGDTWEEIGRVKATHPAAHGRKITKWRLRR